jgi:hypothetical protein
VLLRRCTKTGSSGRKKKKIGRRRKRAGPEPVLRLEGHRSESLEAGYLRGRLPVIYPTGPSTEGSALPEPSSFLLACSALVLAPEEQHVYSPLSRLLPAPLGAECNVYQHMALRWSAQLFGCEAINIVLLRSTSRLNNHQFTFVQAGSLNCSPVSTSPTVLSNSSSRLLSAKFCNG